jgi:hypothetical protein
MCGQVPKEFRLPKAHYQELVFTNAAFTRDSSCVVATIFRNICIWQISNAMLLTSMQVRARWLLNVLVFLRLELAGNARPRAVALISVLAIEIAIFKTAVFVACGTELWASVSRDSRR